MEANHYYTDDKNDATEEESLLLKRLIALRSTYKCFILNVKYIRQSKLIYGMYYI